MQRKIFYFLLLLILCPVLLTAGTKGRIKGKVIDLQTGEALIGANVVVVGTQSGANSDANGEYVIPNLDPGVYSIKASYVGYQTITITGVRVNADLTAYYNIELPSEDIQVGTVEIVAKRPLIQKDNTNAVRITTGEDIQNLPVRGFNSVLNLSAGVANVNGAYYIRGGRSDEVGYYIEGVSVRNPRGGGRAVSIAQDAIEEMQVQAGGYTAEFGGANAGIVRTTLKSGGQQLKANLEYVTDNVGFQSGKNAFDGKKRLGTYWWGYDETSFSLSGPLFDPRIKFFTNINYTFNRSPQHQDQPAIDFGYIWDPRTPADKRDTVNFVFNNGSRPKAARNYWTFTGTVNLDFKPLLFRISGSYFVDDNDANANGPYNTMNDRPGEYQNRNGSFNLKMTHVLSPSLYYEVSAGYVLSTYQQWDKWLTDDLWAYGDSIANANVGFVWSRSPQDIALGQVGRFTTPRALQVYDWTFNRTGAANVGYQKNDTRSLNLTGALSWVPNKFHTIKIGGDYTTWTFRNYVPTASARQLYNALNDPTNTLTSDELKTKILKNNGSTVYGYDYAGNVYDADDIFIAPKKPVFAAAYFTDKIEYEDIILNLGLRYEYYDINNYEMKDPTRPDFSINKTDVTFIRDGWVPVPAFSAVSPRIGISFPVTNKTFFHAQYGKFVQQPDLNQSYAGYDAYAQQVVGGLFYTNMVGMGLRPTRTTQYEIGFTQEVADFLSFDVTAYYRDIKDLVQMTNVTVDIASGYSSYYTRENVDFATTKGIEVSLNMRRYERLQVNANASFQDAKGTGSSPNSSRGIVGAPIVAGQPYNPKNIAPLEFERPFMSNINIDYRFGDNDGPAILNNFGINMLITYQAGRPFTRAIGNPSSVGTTVSGTGDARFREPVEPLGSSATPSYFNIDLRVDKSFRLIDRLRANIYVSVLNLLNTKNVNNVYLLTGSATDDGYLSNPLTYQEQLASQGQTYLDMWQLLNLQRNGLFSGMREVRLGIRLEY
jgi:outer membrane receptor protein involved in Fe transport